MLITDMRPDEFILTTPGLPRFANITTSIEIIALNELYNGFSVMVSLDYKGLVLHFLQFFKLTTY